MPTLSEINLDRLRESGLILKFVTEHNGEWNHSDWLSFCAKIESQGFTPIDLDQVGLLLEDKKAELFHR